MTLYPPPPTNDAGKQKKITNWVVAVIFFHLFCWCLWSWKTFYAWFPRGWQWPEIFISFGAGLVRRGGVGSILFFLANHGVNIRQAATVFGFVAWLVFFVSYVKTVYESIDWRLAAFIVTSPAGVAFFMHYAHLRDVLFFALLEQLMWLSRKSEIKYTHLASVAIISFLGSLMIYEVLIFFLPMVFFVLYAQLKNGNLHMGRGRLALYCLSVLLLAVIFVIVFRGTKAQGLAMAQQWSTVIDGYKLGGGMGAIGGKMSGTFTGAILLDEWRKNFIAANVLAFAPVFAVVSCYGLIEKVMEMFKTVWERVFLFVAMISPLTFHFVAYDAGRATALYMVGMVLFLISLCKVCGWNMNMRENEGVGNMFLFVPALLVYSLCWNLHVYKRDLVRYDWQNMSFIFIVTCVAYGMSHAIRRREDLAGD